MEHLAARIFISLGLLLAALLGFRRWLEMFTGRLLAGWELALGLLLLLVYLTWAWRAWGTALGYPALLLLPLAIYLQEPFRRRLERRRRLRWAESDLERCRELVRLDPLNHGVYEDMAWLYAARGDYEDALASIRKARELAPCHPAYQHLLHLLLDRKCQLFRPCPHCGVELRKRVARCHSCGRQVPRMKEG